jgi:hypothetical protein
MILISIIRQGTKKNTPFFREVSLRSFNREWRIKIDKKSFTNQGLFSKI